MRVILKPGGLIALAVAFAVGTVGVFMMGRGNGSTEQAAGTAGPSSQPALTTPVEAYQPDVSRPIGMPPAPSGATGAVERKAGNLFRESAWKFYTEKAAVATQTPLAGKEAPAQPAFRFAVTTLDKDAWNVGFNQKIEGAAFANKEKVRLRFWARSKEKALVTVIMQEDAPPFPHCWKQDLRPTPEWKEYAYTFETDAYRTGQALVNFFLGTDVGTVEIAGMTLERVL